MPDYFECQRCTACCRWPGLVRITSEDVGNMSRMLGLSESGFVEAYTRLSPNRSGLVLKEKADGSCCLLEGAGCRVHPVKPGQCSGFPNLWNFPGFEAVCRSRKVVVDEAEFLRRTGKPYRPPRQADAPDSN